MGSLPGTVFERLLDAVAAGQSAGLMEQLNVLVNAGHSPLSLARQTVRFLRNALMAQLGGEQTQLLQISADERARAARTALLFTEEELTRNLQIMLRTFDDLNYRQEQRFHLELGLLKLIHAQRLLPIEELLSGVAGGAGARVASRANVPRSATGPPASAGTPSRENGAWSRTPATLESAAPEIGSAAAHAHAAPAAATTREPRPFPAVAAQAAGYASETTLTEGALAKAPEAATATADGLTVEHLRESIEAALARAGHVSAAQLLGSGAWTLDAGGVRIAVAGLGKKMLSLTVNAAVEKIVRQELQRLGAPPRFAVTPGEGSAPDQPAKPVIPAGGSIQEAALAHPLVKRAQELFKAEVRSVVDLRQK